MSTLVAIAVICLAALKLDGWNMWLFVMVGSGSILAEIVGGIRDGFKD